MKHTGFRPIFSPFAGLNVKDDSFFAFATILPAAAKSGGKASVLSAVLDALDFLGRSNFSAAGLPASCTATEMAHRIVSLPEEAAGSVRKTRFDFGSYIASLFSSIRHHRLGTEPADLPTVEQGDAAIPLFSDGLAGCLCELARLGRRSPKKRVFFQTNGVTAETKAAPPKQGVPPDPF